LQWGDANTGCPPQIFVIFQNFKRSPWIRPPPQISTQIYATEQDIPHALSEQATAKQNLSMKVFQVSIEYQVMRLDPLPARNLKNNDVRKAAWKAYH
jgi:hypothetical protein